MDAVRALGGLALIPSELQMIANVNPLDQEHLVFRLLDLPPHLGKKPAVARRDLARLQRAPEGAGESAACRGHDVIERGRMGVMLCDVDPVMFGHRSVDPEQDRDRLDWKKRPPERPPNPLDADARSVYNVTHELASLFSRPFSHPHAMVPPGGIIAGGARAVPDCRDYFASRADRTSRRTSSKLNGLLRLGSPIFCRYSLMLALSVSPVKKMTRLARRG